MASVLNLEQYLTPLLAGDRIRCREVMKDFGERIEDPIRLYHEFLWPVMEQVEKLYRSDRINAASEHMATRINRSIADQIQLKLKRRPVINKRLVISCADGEPEELGAQMLADMFEYRGWEVIFLGGGVPNDEILSLLGQIRPDLLLIYGTQPTGVPGVRALIDLIREIDVTPTMNIMVSGGVFNRADGLWKEVNADLFVKTAKEAIPTAETAPARIPVPKVPGAPKKRRRRRRPPILATAST